MNKDSFTLKLDINRKLTQQERKRYVAFQRYLSLTKTPRLKLLLNEEPDMPLHTDDSSSAASEEIGANEDREQPEVPVQRKLSGTAVVISLLFNF